MICSGGVFHWDRQLIQWRTALTVKIGVSEPDGQPGAQHERASHGVRNVHHAVEIPADGEYQQHEEKRR